MRGLVILAGAGLIWLAGEAFAPSNLAMQAGDAGASTGGAATDSRPVLVELFTSEGCSSCPPADRLLIELQKSQPVAGTRVIALGEHVDYWNRLGWADPFSSAEFSARQEDYAAIFARDGIYTPQMIVDGHREFVGNDRRKAFEAITNSAGLPKADIQVTRDSGTATANPDEVKLHVRVAGLGRELSRQRADLWLAITEDDLVSNVARGENSGRRLQHVAVVRQMRAIGQVEPDKSQTFSSDPSVTLKPEWRRGKLNAVVFLQERNAKRILGAASLPL